MTNQELVAFVRRNPIGVGSAVFALACGLGLYFRSEQLPAAVAELEQVSAEGERLASNIRNGAQLVEQSALVDEADRLIEARLIRPGELAKNLQFFYKLESETGVKLLDLRQVAQPARAGSNKASYVGVPFAVSVEGEYSLLLEFLRRLEHGSVYSRVLTVHLTDAGNDLDRGGPLKLDLSLELLGVP